MTEWRLRSCPRCNGDMFSDTDLYGWTVKCLQCGYVRYSGYADSLDRRPDTEKEKEKVVANAGRES